MIMMKMMKMAEMQKDACTHINRYTHMSNPIRTYTVVVEEECSVVHDENGDAAAAVTHM